MSDTAGIKEQVRDVAAGRSAGKAEGDWTATNRQLPPEGVEVLTMNSGGQVSTLVYSSNLWWFPDRSMYVYYQPLFWRRCEP